MKILTVDNQCYELDDIPEVVEDLRYGVLDYSNPKNVDYFFIPLVFLESFYSPAAVLQVGENTINIPQIGVLLYVIQKLVSLKYLI